MDLPYDICVNLVKYLSIPDMLQFRITANENCEYVKTFEGWPSYQTKSLISVPLWHRCFPNIKYLDIADSEVATQEDYKYFTKVEDLTVCVLDIQDAEDILKPCIRLNTLKIYSYFHNKKGEMYHFIDPMFRYIPHLRKLHIFSSGYITDDALSHLHELEELYLFDCYQISSVGIQYLKKLKKLHIQEQPNIKNSALKNGTIEEFIHLTNEGITYEGILQLPNLKHLICRSKLGDLRGFKHLHTLKIEEQTITDFSYFENIPNITFNMCRFQAKNYEKINTKTLNILNTTMDFPKELKNVTSQAFHIIHCAHVMPYVSDLRAKFGSKIYIL